MGILLKGHSNGICVELLALNSFMIPVDMYTVLLGLVFGFNMSLRSRLLRLHCDSLRISESMRNPMMKRVTAAIACVPNPQCLKLSAQPKHSLAWKEKGRN